jgi:cytochrome c oxidase subunit 3/cytochrome o ubiquinol oxidase subunit 3
MAQAVRSDIDRNDPGRGLDLRKLGMWTFLGSEVFFFGALIVTHLIMRGTATRSHPGPNPRELFGNNGFTSFLAFVLLFSSMTMVLSLDALRRNKIKRFRGWLAATILCGLIFLGGQVYEFNHLFHEEYTAYVYDDAGKLVQVEPSSPVEGEGAAEGGIPKQDGLTLRSSMFGSTFFTMTGFHGTHVFVGVIWLTSILVSSLLHPKRYNSNNYMALEMGGLYWHFVDLVWVAIFTLVYLI